MYDTSVKCVYKFDMKKSVREKKIGTVCVRAVSVVIKFEMCGQSEITVSGVVRYDQIIKYTNQNTDR